MIQQVSHISVFQAYFSQTAMPLWLKITPHGHSKAYTESILLLRSQLQFLLQPCFFFKGETVLVRTLHFLLLLINIFSSVKQYHILHIFIVNQYS